MAAESLKKILRFVAAALLAGLLCPGAAQAGSPTTIYQSTKLFNVSNLGPENQLPQFVNTQLPNGVLLDDSCPNEIWVNLIKNQTAKLPYRVRDGYDRSQQPTNASIVVLENDFFLVQVYPQWGGRVASIYSKTKNFELLFENSVFQPADLARLNAWISGGIEWNWPGFGHTVFTVAPVFAAPVETERGSILRLYEFDREYETTWQVDLYLPNDEENVYAHVTVINYKPEPFQAYWWTNVGVPLADNQTRVLIECPEGVMSTDMYGLRLQNFPLTDDCGFNAAFTPPQDHSYPKAFGDAREVFLRPGNETQTQPYLWTAYVDGNGRGLVHSHSPVMEGRKFWAWGEDVYDVNRMQFLSSNMDPSLGTYFEMQSGIAPTQFQTFMMNGSSVLQWTEVFSPFDASESPAIKNKLQSSDYNEAVQTMSEFIGSHLSSSAFADTDAFLSSVRNNPVGSPLNEGTGFGSLYELQTNTSFMPSMNFATIHGYNDSTTLPWAELLEFGTFTSSLDDDPQSFMVRPEWIELLSASAQEHGATFLHYLHLGVAAAHNVDYPTAFHYFSLSDALKPNILSRRNTAYLLWQQGNVTGASNMYEAAWLLHNSSASNQALREQLVANLAAEICLFYFTNNMQNQLVLFYASIPTYALTQNYVQMASAYVAQYLNKPLEVLSILNSTAFTYPVGTTDLVDLWFSAYYSLEASKLGRPLSDLEMVLIRRANPAPSSIDFRGGT